MVQSNIRDVSFRIVVCKYKFNFLKKVKNVGGCSKPFDRLCVYRIKVSNAASLGINPKHPVFVLQLYDNAQTNTT